MKLCGTFWLKIAFFDCSSKIEFLIYWRTLTALNHLTCVLGDPSNAIDSRTQPPIKAVQSRGPSDMWAGCWLSPAKSAFKSVEMFVDSISFAAVVGRGMTARLV